MRGIARRGLIAGAGALAASPLFTSQVGAQAPAANPRVVVTTDHGAFTAEIFADKAPITAGNFLRYVDTRRYDDTQFYRALRNSWDATTGLIEAGMPNHPERLLAPIAHEPTTQTGLKNLDGTLSLARFEPGSGRADFSICVGDTPSLDADPAQPGDNLGFAVFGRVVEGMEVVHAILALPTNGPAQNPVMQGQILSPPVTIVTMRRK